MSFNSYIFIFLFLPITVIGFYLLKKLNKSILLKLWMIGMTLWFYAYAGPQAVLLLILSVFTNYIFVYLLIRKRNKGILATGVLCNLVCLFFFKYFDFFIENCNVLFRTDFVFTQILLPLGISFYTFVQISFLVDTYHGEVKQCSLVDYCSFVLFFPQLVSGPIVTNKEMLPQITAIEKKDFDSELFCKSIILFVLGLGKKVLLADVFAKAVNWGFANVEALDSTNGILVMLFFTIQLYFDFSGYSDMAKGLAGMLGFTLPINFNSPLKAVNLIDFWKRWHMSLTRFLTHYVYFPLGGNRKGKMRTYLNLLIVFLVSGIWHGAAWTFIIWGIIHGVCYVITKLCLPFIKRIPAIITGVFTYLIVNIAFVFFRSESVSQAHSLLKTICSFRFGAVQAKLSSAFELPELWYVLKITNLAKQPLGHLYCLLLYLTGTFGILFFAKNTNELTERMKPRFISAILLAFLFIWSVASLSGVSTFLYSNF